jgi:hypothetical protein
VLIAFAGDLNPYAFRRKELTVVGRGLNAGDWVQVIDRKHHDNGMGGVIDEIGDKMTITPFMSGPRVTRTPTYSGETN